MSPAATSQVAARPLPREDRRARDEHAHLRVVRPRRRHLHTGPVVAVALVVVFASVLASAVFHSVLVTGQGRLDDLQGRVARSTQDVARQRLALAEAQSPDKLAAAAQTLGLVIPPKQIWLATPAPDGTTPPPVVIDRGPSPTTPASPTTVPGATTGSTTPAATSAAAGTGSTPSPTGGAAGSGTP